MDAIDTISSPFTLAIWPAKPFPWSKSKTLSGSFTWYPDPELNTSNWLICPEDAYLTSISWSTNLRLSCIPSYSAPELSSLYAFVFLRKPSLFKSKSWLLVSIKLNGSGFAA